MSDVTIKNAPARIYLTVGPDLPEGEWDFKRLHEVLWCEDRQGPDDLEYVLASTVRRRVNDATEMQRLKRRVTNDFLAASGVVPTGRTLEAMHKALDAIFEAAVPDAGSAETAHRVAGTQST